MLDHYLYPVARPLLRQMARVLRAAGVRADHITVTGFVIGILAVPLIITQWYTIALGLFLFNRLCDGLDGERARLDQPSDAGSFLDITLEMLVYQSIAFAFGVAEPDNLFWALILMLSLAGTGLSFSVLTAMAEKDRSGSRRGSPHSTPGPGGPVGGVETIAVFTALCLWPQLFPLIVMIFAPLSLITTVIRIIQGYRALLR